MGGRVVDDTSLNNQLAVWVASVQDQPTCAVDAHNLEALVLLDGEARQVARPLFARQGSLERLVEAPCARLTCTRSKSEASKKYVSQRLTCVLAYLRSRLLTCLLAHLLARLLTCLLAYLYSRASDAPPSHASPTAPTARPPLSSPPPPLAAAAHSSPAAAAQAPRRH